MRRDKMLKKTTRISLVDQVVKQIEQLIEQGKWQVGEKIPPEQQLVEQFDVSRNTLREAIRALVHAGLLETKQGSGTIVRSSSSLGVALHRHVKKSSLFETLEVRLALEREAAILAAQRRDETDLEKLTQYIERCQLAIKESDIKSFVENDILFHKSIVAAAKNEMLLELYEHITEPIYDSIYDLVVMDADFQFEKEIHSELLDAIKEQNVVQATAHVNEYLANYKQKWGRIVGGMDE